MSGIATETNKLAGMLKHSKLCTLRKGHPGMILNEKRAVQIGGGLSHRLNLDDGILIKDNHLDAISSMMKVDRPKAAKLAVERMKEKRLPVEIECSDYETAESACSAGASIILLDNLTARDAKEIAKKLKDGFGVKIEASGGITPVNIKQYDSIYIDYISTSWMVYNSKPADFSMEIVK
ncbi:hypothetical protein COX84_00360 [Candidatus Micrarchaeota archaeon CG_4_10_14_0_2_um_filter_49_7]|nr:MAG: hypothetical protein COX84_00360 [Candidatus Micrarchaeota archaeon CG_4_10_14_0_2_um_filter_49_7]